ncbi:MAG TPA: quinoprotein relay system zinc metallohydrolase 1, partial [Burkholderiales bacterium]|nr:quinoprotein relay system zinc metallohydrolase 1 [Burkholderiales bacterium]
MRGAAAVGLALAAGIAGATDFDYGLAPEQVGPGSYVFVGATEDFSVRNGGNIVNTGFIVTSAGVVVIDTGPSKRYGEQMRVAIGRVTPKPVVKVFNTHHHPDHFLGNQGYADVGIAALAATAQAIAAQGNALAENMYRMNGDWMKGTEPLKPGEIVTAREIRIGDRVLTLLALSGHTAGDLAVYDRSTGVLFAGDLVFHDRAATTPHADIGAWLASLDALEQLPFTTLVPGHGPVVRDAVAIRQTRDYLTWLRGALGAAVEQGLDMNEAMAL